MNTGSPQLVGVRNPFQAVTGGIALLPFVLAPLPSGGDDYAALQALLNLWLPQSVRVFLQPGVYLISQELSMPATSAPGMIQGAGHNYTGSGGTTIRATASMRSVLAVLHPYGTVTDLKLDANQQATYGMFLNSSSLGRYENVYATNAKLDGFYLEISTGQKLNDTSIFTQLWAVDNGTVYTTAGIASQYVSRKSTITGTATVVAANATITIAAGTDLTTLGIRKGDYVRTGSGAKNAASTFAGQVDSVTSTTIVLAGAPPNLPIAAQAGSGLQFAIGVGDGFHEIISGDNNINLIQGGIFRGNAGAGISLHGLFGDTVIAAQADGNVFYSYVVGDCNNANAVNGVTFIRCYSESDGRHGDFFFGDVRGLTMMSCTGPIIAGAGSNGSGSTAHGQIMGNSNNDPVAESIDLGLPQNFVVEVQNNGGVIQHRYVSDHVSGTLPALASRINGVAVAYTNTPTVSNVVPFVAGAGLLTGFPTNLLLDSPTSQPITCAFGATIEFNSTGASLIAMPSIGLNNVNGTTIGRATIYLTDTAGALKNWDTATIPAGKSIAVRVNGWFR